MKITLRQLAIFEAVARLNSVSQAAKELHLSQSAASLALQDLEHALGVALFDRRQKKLSLNGHGLRLQPQARSMLAMAQEIESATPDSPAGVLRVAATATIGNYLLPRLCTDFLSLRPNVQIRFSVAEEAEILEKVQEFALDLGFIEGGSTRHMLMVEPWLKDELVVIASPRHWAASRTVPMQALRDETWFLQPIGSSTRHRFTQAYSAVLWSSPIRFESNSLEAIKGAVAAGNALGCLSRLAVHDELASGRLVALRIANFHITRDLSMVTRKDAFQAEPQAGFIEQARRFAGRRDRH